MIEIEECDPGVVLGKLPWLAVWSPGGTSLMEAMLDPARRHEMTSSLKWTRLRLGDSVISAS